MWGTFQYIAVFIIFFKLNDILNFPYYSISIVTQKNYLWFLIPIKI